MDNFLFFKKRPTIACSKQMAQIQRKKKNGRPGLEKKTL